MKCLNLISACLVACAPAAFAELLITEVMSGNKTVLRDQDGDSSDWIELHNSGVGEVNIDGYFLTDDSASPKKWKLPARKIPSGGFFLIFASGKNRQAPEPHTNFRLSSSGEYLALVLGDGKTLAQEFKPKFPSLAKDKSFGLAFSGGVVSKEKQGVLDQPTPGRANGTVVSLGQVADTKFSVDRGFHDKPISVAITSATPGARIRYTRDGSTPSPTNGEVYSGPISISQTTPLRALAYREGYTPSNVDTQTYLFLDDLMKQPSTPPEGWPRMWINGQKFSYGMDAAQRVGTTEAVMKQAFHSIDSICLNTDLKHLFDPKTGIYTHPDAHGAEWERPVSVEILRGGENVHINAGLRIRGGFSRSGDNPKHAFRVFFRREYGKGKLKFPLFGKDALDLLDNIDLQTSQNYSWAFQGSARNTMVREVFARDLQGALGQPHTRGRYCHLYVNGQYWGLYMSQERPEAAFAAGYLGGKPDDYDNVKSSGNHGDYGIEVSHGDLHGWKAFWELANRIAASSERGRTPLYRQIQGLNPDGTRNPNYPVYLDPDNLIDYMLTILYVGSYDAPVSNFLGNTRPNNWFSLWNRVSRDRGFQFFVHDCEHSLGTGSGASVENRNGPWPCGSTLDSSNPQWIHQQLMSVEAYRLRFADRVQRALVGPLSPENARARANDRASQIDLAIHAEAARWGDAKRAMPFTHADWLNEMVSLRNYLGTRHEVLLEQLRGVKRFSSGVAGAPLIDAPLYPSVAAPSLSRQGGFVERGFSLILHSQSGRIYYTLDGSDPRREDGTPSPTARVLSGGGLPDKRREDVVLLSESAPMKAYVPSKDMGNSWRTMDYDDANWKSGLAGAGYDTQSTYASLIKIDLLKEMNGKNTTLYTRSRFQISDPASLDKLILRMKFEDGFLAYLNGTEVARFNAVPPVAWNSDANALHDDSAAVEWEEFDISSYLGKLVVGGNILAIQGLNDSLSSSDMLILPELRASRLVPPILTLEEGVVLPTGFVPIMARTLDHGVWSALSQANFQVDAIPAVAGKLVLSGIMYHPSPPTAQEIAAGFKSEDFEYLELMNIAAKSISLSGASFASGLKYKFPDEARSLLAPGQRLFLAKNTSAFSLRYGKTGNLVGPFSGSLDNEGETLVLLDAAGTMILKMDFDDAGPWAMNADGQGAALVLLNPQANPDPSLAANWTPKVPDHIAAAPDPNPATDGDAQLSLTVEIVGQGKVKREPDIARLSPGTMLSLTPIPNPGWEFVAWSGGVNGSEVPLSLRIDASRSITATFRERPNLTLNTNIVGQGSLRIDPPAPAYPLGQVVTIEVTPAIGFRFVGWTGDYVGTDNPLRVTMDSAKSISANFVRLRGLRLSVKGPGTISVNPDLPAYDEGSVVTLTPTPFPDARFTEWQGDASGAEFPLKLTMNKDKAVVAKFSALARLETHAQGQGKVEVSPLSPEYLVGQEISLSALPDPGWRFVEWKGALTGKENPRKHHLLASNSITAVFAKNAPGFAEWIEQSLGAKAKPETVRPLDNPDGDAFNNLLEYALGGDPGSPAALEESIQLGNLGAVGSTVVRLILPVFRDDLTYQMEVSWDLAKWKYNGDGTGLTYFRELDVDEGWRPGKFGMVWELLPGQGNFLRLRVALK